MTPGVPEATVAHSGAAMALEVAEATAASVPTDERPEQAHNPPTPPAEGRWGGREREGVGHRVRRVGDGWGAAVLLGAGTAVVVGTGTGTAVDDGSGGDGIGTRVDDGDGIGTSVDDGTGGDGIGTAVDDGDGGDGIGTAGDDGTGAAVSPGPVSYVMLGDGIGRGVSSPAAAIAATAVPAMAAATTEAVIRTARIRCIRTPDE